jgi:hypothetical protein
MARIKINDSGKPDNKWLIVRNSPVHGYGCFARRDIKKGQRLIEYLGDRISHKDADKRYEDADPNDNHTFLFIADRKTVIDATTGGNESRFINHSCDGNCTSEIEKGRVFIDATKNIRKGEELGYDYQIPRDRNDPANVDKIYACRCGSPMCRGTMLWPAKRPKPRKKVKAKAKKPSAAKKTSRNATAKKSGSPRKAKTKTKTKSKTKRGKAKR